MALYVLVEEQRTNNEKFGRLVSAFRCTLFYKYHLCYRVCDRTLLPVGVLVNANNAFTILGRNNVHLRRATSFIHENFCITWDSFGFLVDRVYKIKNRENRDNVIQ